MPPRRTPKPTAQPSAPMKSRHDTLRSSDTPVQYGIRFYPTEPNSPHLLQTRNTLAEALLACHQTSGRYLRITASDESQKWIVTAYDGTTIAIITPFVPPTPTH